MATIHACGQCGQQFESEETYLDHQCGVTNLTPKDFGHAVATNENFGQQAETGLIRGNLRKALEERGVDPETAQALSANVSTQEEADAVLGQHPVQ